MEGVGRAKGDAAPPATGGEPRRPRQPTWARWRYDRFGRLTTLVNPNRESWRFEYDAAGRLTGQRDYAGRLTEYRHDALGQVTEVIRHPLPGSADAPLVTAFEYDVLGRLTARETAEHRTEYRHSTLSLEIRRATRAEWRQALLEEREPEWDAVLVFTRNAAGELVSEENHGGKFEYEYDALGNLSSTLYPDGRELATLRYGTGHLLEMQLRHGGAMHTLAAYGRDRLHREISRSQGVLSQETRYDAAGRVTQRTVLDARRELVFERRYRWDRTDQIVQQIHTDATPATPGEKYSQYLWGYDAAGQVTKAVEPQKEERFFWDPAGNRTEEYRNPVWHNLLLRLDGLKLDYDGFGRLTRRQDKSGVIQHFAYDDEQRVKEITFTGHAEFKRVEYRYDPLGRRTHKVLWRYNDPQPETIRFDWQGLQLAGEQSDREPDHYVQYVYTEGSYEPLARVDSVYDDCEIYWYHTELNGLPERVTDADGQTVWRGQFSTWGETERELSVPQWQVPQNLRFQGQYLDRESGLHYNLFRYYDPVTGRYTQMDPIGLAGGINTYSYVGDPLVWVDPLGLAVCSASGKYQPETVLGRTVYKNTVDINPGLPSNVHPSVHKSIRQKVADGWTNLDLMKNGYAPIGPDGKQINLHHVLGQEPGPMVELVSSTHKKYHKALHGLIEDGNSFRHNGGLAYQYDKFRSDYWKLRSLDFM
ncbi:RHS repeat-associated core domain-containing protein [Cronobacter sakazakii]|uniref:RHS repeat-associated core domain-containing protein n=1 Tax=Cronobacter sakazakii TaxID=28141 RepID=UPI004037D957